MLGDGRPLLSDCVFFTGWTRRGGARKYFPESKPLLGPDSIRRIECQADWRVEPAPELAAVAAGQRVDVNTLMAGILLAQATIVGSNGDRGAASARAAEATEPRIAAVRKVVRKAGSVRIQLELNPAAERLLTRKKQLTVRLRLSFEAEGRKQVVRTERVTITAPVAPSPALKK